MVIAGTVTPDVIWAVSFTSAHRMSSRAGENSVSSELFPPTTKAQSGFCLWVQRIVPAALHGAAGTLCVDAEG